MSRRSPRDQAFVSLRDFGAATAEPAGANAKGRLKWKLTGGIVRLAEVHWYEATGKGQHEFKIKRYLD